MEQKPFKRAESDEPQEPRPIGDLIEPTLDEIERREMAAGIRDEELKTALMRQAEAQKAVMQDPSLEQVYADATEQVRRLVGERQEAENLTDPGQPSDSE